MKRLFAFVLLSAGIALAQTPVPIIPQSQQSKIFNAVSTAQTSGCLTNQGQNVWISSYLISGGTPTAIQYRLEYSYNSDAATCSTGTWFAMSDDADDRTEGEVIGIGSYPFVRANLVTCSGCSASITLTAFYTASSSMPEPPYGFYNRSQRVRAILFTFIPGNNAFTTPSIPTPYGSSAGFIVFNTSNSLSGSSQIQVTISYGATTTPLPAFTLPAGVAGFSVSIPIAAVPATAVTVTYTGGSGANRLVSADYYFYPLGTATPVGGQQGSVFNSESVSAANALVTKSLDVSSSGLMSAHVFSVSARCSAGTAQLTIVDGGTTNSISSLGNLWSTASTEVGTTTFRYQWNPGLQTTPGNGALITLSSCGVGNTGTLDVQGSVF